MMGRMSETTRKPAAKTEARKPKRRRAKGSGGYHKEGREHVYVLDLGPDPATGKPRRKKFKSIDKGVALEKFNTAKRKYMADGTIRTSNGPELGPWLLRWLEETKRPNLKPRVYGTYLSEIRTISKHIGGVRVAELTPDHVRLLAKAITDDGRSSKTALNTYIRLSSAMRDAVAEGLADSNPCLVAGPPRVEANPTAILGAGQPSLLIEQATVRPVETKRKRGQNRDPDNDEDRRMWRLMWRVAFETGMRQGERFAITRGDIIESNGTPYIHVCHELQRYTSGTDIPSWLKARNIDGNIWMVTPKSRRGVRVAPIGDLLRDDLIRWCDDHDIGTGDLVFTRHGHPLTNPVERRRWYKALEGAGLPRVTIRSARHWFSTRLAMAGASEDARKAIMGHAEISTTAGYTHWDAAALRQITGSVVSAISDAD